jgi:deazaflavin-dependent oxidoreductase (nitroreductase family)
MSSGGRVGNPPGELSVSAPSPTVSYCGQMPSDLGFKAMNAFHRSVLAITGGRIGWRAGGMPVAELTTTGRKSGRLHTVMLTSPVQEGDTVVVVGSRGGDDRNPAWFLNLLDHPEVEVAFAGKPKKPMRARVATSAERAALWPRVTAASEGYANYQTKTDREIPLVLLEPPDPEP